MLPNIMIKEVAMNYKLVNMWMKKHSEAFNPLKDIWTVLSKLNQVGNCMTVF